MEELQIIKSVDFETIDGNKYEVTTIKKPVYSDQQKEELFSKLEDERVQKTAVWEALGSEISDIIEKQNQLRN